MFFENSKFMRDSIFVKPNVLSKDFCDNVILKFEEDDRKQQGITGAGFDETVKKTNDLFISRLEEWKEMDTIFFDTIQENVKAYFEISCKINPRFFNNLNYNDTGYNLQKYVKKSVIIYGITIFLLIILQISTDC